MAKISSAADESVSGVLPLSEMHLDDFLNVTADKTGHIEMVSAFGKRCKSQGVYKQPEESWQKAYLAFTQEIPT